MLTDFLDAIEKFKTLQLSKIIDALNARVFSELDSPRFTPLIAPFFTHINKEGEPFTHFELEPDNITQIKKLINALYHARLALLDLEHMNIHDLGDSYQNIKLLWNHTIEEVYQASYLFTHLDIDIREMFGQELSMIMPLISQLDDVFQKKTGGTQKMAETLKTFPLSYKVGEVTGTAVQQMRPSTGDYDYSFLTQFSADLPGYIDSLSKWIREYSSVIIKQQVHHNHEGTEELQQGAEWDTFQDLLLPVDRKKTEELQQVALSLLNDIEHLKGNSLFVSLKFLKYIHVVNHIITLSMRTLDEIGNLNDSSQDVIRDNLAQLKYKLLPELFSLVDKIEEHTLLTPGTLSLPLMSKTKELYALLIEKASIPVNFQVKGEELLSIEDAPFINARLAGTHQRIDSAKSVLFKIKKAQAAFDGFYKMVESLDGQTYLSQLSRKTKDELIEYYKLIKPYVMQADVDANEAIINALQGSAPWFANKYISTAHPKEKIASVLEIQKKIQQVITKKKETQNFYLKLNSALEASITQHAELVLFPYKSKGNLFITDEFALLSLKDAQLKSSQFKNENHDIVIIDKKQLTFDQAFELHQLYAKKQTKFEKALKSYMQFLELLKEYDVRKTINGKRFLDFSNLPKGLKAELRILYMIFQPYFIDGVLAGFNDSAADFDIFLVRSFDATVTAPIAPALDLFGLLEEHYQKYFSTFDLMWRKKSNEFLKLAEETHDNEYRELPLQVDAISGNRHHHVIQHTYYSKFAREFRIALFEVTSLFNEALRKSLTPQTYGVPFPELEDSNLVLAEAQYVIALKQVFNSLYYIEEILLQLEKLNNKSWESMYVLHLYYVYKHLLKLHSSMERLKSDPKLKFIIGELYNKTQLILATVQEHSEAYKVASETISNEPITTNSLWYSLNAFYISPKHIRALRNTHYLTAEELNQLHSQAKNATVVIENLIKNSSSYFKLFLQSPKMLKLYRELTNKMNEFISTSHDAVMNNLDQFQSQIFTPMLVEADRLEDSLGLQPGLFSAPLKNIIDEYYKGLLKPLSLDSKTHIDLACDKTPLNQRVKHIQGQIEEVTTELVTLRKRYRAVEVLNTGLEKHASLQHILPCPEHSQIAAQASLVSLYKEALPTLVKLQKTLNIGASDAPADIVLDQYLNSTINEFDFGISNIRGVANAAHHKYLGLQATAEMKLATAKEKLAYLQDLEVSQDNDKEDFVKKYTTESFTKQVKELSKRHIGLHFTYREYTKKIGNYLLTFQDEIIDKAKLAEDINQEVNSLLKDKISQFEQIHYPQFYQLEMIRAALSKFNAYFDHSNAEIEHGNSLVENKVSLNAKVEQITTLADLCKNKSLPVADRILAIKNHVKNPNFERIMLSHQEVNTLSFNFLALAFLSLLEALYLYTPPRKKIYIQLNQAIKEEIPINELTHRFGLFVKNDTLQARPEVHVSNTLINDDSTSHEQSSPPNKRDDDASPRVLVLGKS